MHPHRLIGPSEVNVVDLQGTTRLLGSVILVSVMPEEYAEHFRTDRQGPEAADFVRGVPPGYAPESYWARRPCINYHMPAAPEGGRGRDGWSALSIYTCVAKTENISSDHGSNGYSTSWYGAQQEAERLMGTWGAFPGERISGVGLRIFHKVEDITPAAIADMQRDTEIALRRVVDSADAMYATEDPLRRAMISARHRFAANVLGLDRKWAASSTPSKPCPACHSSMNARAVRCAECGTDVREFYVEEIQKGYRTFPEVASLDPSVATMVERALSKSGADGADSAGAPRRCRPRKADATALPAAEPLETQDEPQAPSPALVPALPEL